MEVLNVNDSYNEEYIEIMNKIDSKISKYQDIYNIINSINLSLNSDNQTDKTILEKEIRVLKGNIITLQTNIEYNRKIINKVEDLVYESNRKIDGEYVVNRGENLLPREAIKRRVNEFESFGESLKKYNNILNEIISKIGV